MEAERQSKNWDAIRQSYKMSEKEYRKLSVFIHGECGIKLPPAKKVMMTSRLSKRLRILGFESFNDYFEFVCSPEGREREYIEMINAITTNKTDFMRDQRHFEYLVETAVPHLIDEFGIGVRRAMRIWSAGCSSGEEPYTMSMYLEEFATGRSDFSYSILATDISTKVLEKAALAIYDHHKIEPVPLPLRKKYLLRSRDRTQLKVRIVPELRKRIAFKQLNFMDENFDIHNRQDVIFCRNVIIYFKRDTQEEVLNRICDQLRTNGYLFTGPSETLSMLNLPLKQVAPSVYRKQ